MNYYERIQNAIDYIEDRLDLELGLPNIAKEAYMSLSSFYRLFFSMTGFTVKEYIRRRRISKASWILQNPSEKVIDIALQFGFESQEAFSRSFKQLTGMTPGVCRKTKRKYEYGRINLMEQCFEEQDNSLSDKYPDIKVLKELKPIRVAYYRYIGKSPEGYAWKVLMEWVKRMGLNKPEYGTRFYGFNNPNPPPDWVMNETEYGYEVWATIPENLKFEDDKIKSKIFEGGKYAVMSIAPDDGYAIVNAWKRFGKWLLSGRYMSGSHQWLEEHIELEGECPFPAKMDLYMPISDIDKEDFRKSLEFVTIEPFTVASCRISGPEPWNDAWDVLLDWAAKTGFFSEGKKQCFISYNSVPAAYYGTDGFWYEACLRIPDDMIINDDKIRKKQFKGGFYAIGQDKQNFNELRLMNSHIWRTLEKWMFSNQYYTFDRKHQWFQEQWIDSPKQINNLYNIKCCMSVKSLNK